MKELVIKKCLKCGAMVEVLEDCHCESGCGIKCCGESMKVLEPNSVDAATEKHVPIYEVKEDKIYAQVNHVMDEDHYIEWMMIISSKKTVKKCFKPGDEPAIHCKYAPGAIIYAYCNKHGLWKKEVE